MLSAFRSALRLDSVDSSRLSGVSGSVDVDELLEVAKQNLPDWRGAARSCGNVVLPFCQAVGRTLCDDVEAYALALAECEEPPSPTSSSGIPSSSSSSSHKPPRHSFAIPQIVITPCEDTPRETSNWVPFQDACFGTRLVVPSHATVNQVFPPLLAAPSYAWSPGWPERQWRWSQGHWWLVLPSPEEQARRGMNSRAHPRKAPRSGLRKCTRH